MTNDELATEHTENTEVLTTDYQLPTTYVSYHGRLFRFAVVHVSEYNPFAQRLSALYVSSIFDVAKGFL